MDNNQLEVLSRITANREAIEADPDRCGVCLNCRRTIAVTDMDWIVEPGDLVTVQMGAETAVCPHCCVDAVVPNRYALHPDTAPKCADYREHCLR